MVAFLATAVASGAHHSTDSDEECVVNAWVRAEDLAPDHVSHGELRIKVKQAHCANRIASVALRLQLDEFSEVKYLRHGAVIPEIQKSHNQNAPEDFLAPLDGTSNNTVYDYGPYDRALSEAALWEVKAEERIAWSTEAVLFENNPGIHFLLHHRRLMETLQIFRRRWSRPSLWPHRLSITLHLFTIAVALLLPPSLSRGTRTA
ncbi:hypothetical protein C8R44DRAFT_625655 [Mycena epipterygia]|nr:hypothetical protein C8R44DRAFT_625655 [Mycena epipterygia]